MPLLLSVAAVAVVLAAGALGIGARRQSLHTPEGAATRVPDVYELAYLAGGPERNAVTVIEALARGHIISVDGKGQVALRESHGQAAAEASTGGLVPAQLAPVAAGRLPAAGVAAHRDAGGGGVRGGGVDLVPDRGQAARQRG
jgi:uncharacterized protein (TIGR04222 family)